MALTHIKTLKMTFCFLAICEIFMEILHNYMYFVFRGGGTQISVIH